MRVKHPICVPSWITKSVPSPADLLINRNLRHFIELDKTDIMIPYDYDHAQRQVPGYDAAKAKEAEEFKKSMKK